MKWDGNSSANGSHRRFNNFVLLFLKINSNSMQQEIFPIRIPRCQWPGHRYGGVKDPPINFGRPPTENDTNERTVHELQPHTFHYRNHSTPLVVLWVYFSHRWNNKWKYAGNGNTDWKVYLKLWLIKARTVFCLKWPREMRLICDCVSRKRIEMVLLAFIHFKRTLIEVHKNTSTSDVCSKSRQKCTRMRS